MRPLALTFEGLRSYRSKAVIDFSELDLFAIIGDTGAGKSTIIEALSLALYARKSWVGGGSNLVDMIADGVNTMRIELSFHANGHDWVVTRARHRNSSQSVDKLVSPTGGGTVDQARQVTAKIEELIGLTHEQFTRAVVLPQGRFDELLRANDRDRSAILASILGLDAIAKTRDALDTLRSEHKAQAATFIERRRRYPDDPAAELAARTTAAFDLAARADALTDARTIADAAERDLIVARDAAGELARTLAAVPPAPDRSSRTELDTFVTLGASLVALAAQANATSGVLAERLVGVDAEIAEFLAGYASRDDLVARRVELTQLADALPGHLEAYQTALDVHSAVVVAAPADTIDPGFVEAHAAVKAQHSAAQGVARDARERLDDARSLWRDVVSGAVRLVERIAACAPLTAAVARCDADVSDARAALTAADELAGQAAAAHQAALIADAAATAGATCRPGELCPVCTRPLDDDYVAPAAADHRLEESLREKANTALTSCRARLDEAVAASGEARGSFTHAVAARDAARAAFDGAARSAAEFELPVVVVLDDATSVEFDDDEVVLAGYIGAVDAAAKRCAELDELLAVATGNLTAATSALDARQQAYGGELAGAERAVSATRSTLTGIHRTLGSDPSMYLVGDVLVVPDLGAVTDLLTDCSRRLATLEELAGVRAGLEAELIAARQAATDAKDAYIVQVSDPLRAIVDAVNVRSSRVRDVRTALLGALHLDRFDAEGAAIDRSVIERPVLDVTIPAKSDDLVAALDELTGVLARAELIVAAATTSRELCDERARAASDRLAGVLAGVSCANLSELHTTSGLVAGELTRARTEVMAAQVAVAESAALDRVVSIAEPFVANLEVLVASLRDQHFVTHLVKAREAELLAEASRRLKAITNDKFGFHAGFVVVNIASGEKRTPDTLSGGERFQAALALALALVEIASRGAGRLDAVFVDEGFGSLDSNALDVALETLGKVAGAGKMVALISHLRPVAEYVDTVLHVTKDEMFGSRIAVLDSDAREHLLADDVRSGLTI